MKDEKIKICLVGEAKVGKTNIINQFTNQIFNDEYISTISCDKYIKTIELNHEKQLILELWDTAGQEKYRSINKMFLKGSCFIDL